jgi:hypothetical protein
MTTCPQCGGTGWKTVLQDGVSRVRVCGCRRQGTGDRGQGTGFEKLDALIHRNIEALVSSRLVLRVRDLIVTRRGQANAIRIADIRAALPDLDDRKVKDAVEELRTIARLPIAATKVPPYGYFIPQTPEEFDQMFERLRGEGIKLLLLARLFRPHADVVEMLRGQLPLIEPPFDLSLRAVSEVEPSDDLARSLNAELKECEYGK